MEGGRSLSINGAAESLLEKMLTTFANGARMMHNEKKEKEAQLATF